MHIRKLGVVTVGVICLVLSGVPVLAEDRLGGHNDSQEAAAQTQTGSQESETETGGSTKLPEVKLKVCQIREKSIDNIMARIAERGQKQLDLFSNIATKVENFYTQKGKTLSNYDALVADVNAKKTAAQAAVDKIKADKANFKCDGTDPHGASATFKNDLKLEISSLKAFRTSVKNLIVGVKSVQGTTSSTENKTNDTENSTTGGSQ